MEKKRSKLVPEMEGMASKWYAKQRGTQSQLDGYRAAAAKLGLPEGTRVLEVAPGPGYFAIELARRGAQVTGLDVSRTFVGIASEKAKQANVKVDFRHGDVAAMPFASGTFEVIICQAAFKNFTEPGRALAEMHRVLLPGGVAIIEDLDKEATKAEIAREVDGMRLNGFSAFMTRVGLSGLRRRAYTAAQLRELAVASPFGACEVTKAGIGLEVRLQKR